MDVQYGADTKAEFLRLVEKLPPGSTVLDVGSYSAQDGLDIWKAMDDARVFCFECHPTHFKLCQATVADFRGITLVAKAVSDQDGPVTFLPIDPVKSKITTGASSLLRSTGDWAKHLPQNELQVEGTRLDTWAREEGVSTVEAIWIDLQGAEVLALKGLGALLAGVQVIHIEVLFDTVYEGQNDFAAINTFLTEQGFSLQCLGVVKHEDGWSYPPTHRRPHVRAPWSDAVYARPRSSPGAGNSKHSGNTL